MISNVFRPDIKRLPAAFFCFLHITGMGTISAPCRQGPADDPMEKLVRSSSVTRTSSSSSTDLQSFVSLSSCSLASSSDIVDAFSSVVRVVTPRVSLRPISHSWSSVYFCAQADALKDGKSNSEVTVRVKSFSFKVCIKAANEWYLGGRSPLLKNCPSSSLLTEQDLPIIQIVPYYY